MCADVNKSAKGSKTGQELEWPPPFDSPQNSSLLWHLRIDIFIIMLVGAYILTVLAGRAVSAAIESVLRDSSFGKTCTVQPGGSEAIDDAPAILEAFHNCGHNGNVVFLNTTYYVNSVMNVSGLSNCRVDIYGTLLVCCPLL
jgi:hypothetical protein